MAPHDFRQGRNKIHRFGNRRMPHSSRSGLTICAANIRKANIIDSVEVLEGFTRTVAQSGCSAPLVVILLQEALAWGPEPQPAFELNGWNIFGSEGHPCAIVVPARIRGLVERVGANNRCAFLTMSDYMFVSVYALDSGYGAESYASIWEAVDRLVRQHRGRGRFRRRLAICGDFNHQVPRHRWLHQALGAEAARSRFAEASKTDAIVQFATTTGATIWNTSPENYMGDAPGPTPTWRGSDRATTTHIDYVTGGLRGVQTRATVTGGA